MIQKIFLVIAVCFSCMFYSSIFAASDAGVGCSVWEVNDVGRELNSCLHGSKLVGTQNGDVTITWGFKTMIKKWIGIVGGILAIVAVGGVVYGWFMMVISQGEEDKFTNAKKIVIWSLTWFLALVVASTLIAVVINVFYWL